MTEVYVGTPELEEEAQKDRFLTFQLDAESYAVGIRHVTEIIGLQPITSVPELPDYIRGIINLRGKIIPVMDIRTRFRKQLREYNDRTCIIVVDIKSSSIGLIVDSVSDVLSIPEEQIVSPPGMSKGGSSYIKGIGKTGAEVKLILDCDLLVGENDQVILEEIENTN